MSYIAWVWLEFALAAVTFVALMWIAAPYGRHSRAGWGPSVAGKLGWIVMEAPAVLVFLAVFLIGDDATQPVPLVFLGLWQVHYVHRTFIFPLRLRSPKRMPLVVVGSAIAFNVLNASINAWWVGRLGDYATSWLLDPRFILGVLLFVAGFVINRHSDHILRGLRGPGEDGYKVPEGGLFRFVSCPNYFGEIVQWAGWAVATWSLAGLAFAVYTAANLVPRALQHHRWYQATFPDYPRRKAVLPGLL